MNNTNSASVKNAAFQRLYAIIKKLRGPDGCPWDREQSIQSLEPQLIEECYELIDAITEHDMENQREELGDIYLVLTMMGLIYEEQNSFTLEESLHEASEKLIRRHPHVFSDHSVKDSTEVVELWNSIKRDVEKKKDYDSILSKVRKSLPPLEKAYILQKKASRAGFDWDSTEGVVDKITEELQELQDAQENLDKDAIEEEFGDLLFSVINLGRFLQVDPNIALNRCNKKFTKRFQYMEESMKKAGKTLSKENMNLMETFWTQAKTKDKQK